jgi:uncharacterized protein YjbI with pentapeptide repeats
MIATVRGLVDPPDLPELQPRELGLDDAGALRLDGAVVDATDAAPTDATPTDPAPTLVRRITIRESELRGVALQTPTGSALELRDVRLHGCDLSNTEARDATLWRVDVASSRLLGLRVPDSDVRELRVSDSSLVLATFAYARLRHVSFERVDLSERRS